MQVKQYIEKSIALNAYERKEFLKMDELKSHLRKLEKDEQNKSIEKLRKDNIINK